MTANAELQERELIKLASLASAITESLQARGVSDLAAPLVAEVGMAIFKVGFERWVGNSRSRARSLPQHMRAAHDELKAVTAGVDAPPSIATPTPTSRRRSPTTSKGRRARR